MDRAGLHDSHDWCPCHDRLAAAEAQKNAALQRAWSAEASLSVRVGMRREFEEILGVSDTMEPGAFEVGVARLHRLIAAEARCESVTKWAAEYHAKWQAAEARCAELRGAMDADDCRLREAAIRVWGEDRHGCDTPDWMAEEILTLRGRCAELEAKLGAALFAHDTRAARYEAALRRVREWAGGLGWLGSPQDERVEAEVVAIVDAALAGGEK
jgi:hypothetical protein